MTTIKLADSLKLLNANNKKFGFEIERGASKFEILPQFAHLKEAIQSLDAVRAAKKVVCPADYKQLWLDYLAGKIATLPPRAIRFLCWEIETATDKRFLQLLIRQCESLGARSLQGLVYCRHLRWLPVAAHRDETETVKNLIVRYEGKNRLLAKWKNDVSSVLSEIAPLLVADKLIGKQQTIKNFCAEWGFNEQTAFVSAIIQETASFCFEKMSANKNLRDYFFDEILSWQHFPLGDFKHTVSGALLHDLTIRDEEFQERLLDAILHDVRLGDPRLPGNQKKWAGIAPDARERLVQLLSRADIVFFFEQVMTGYDDRHGRKDFWLQYVKSLQQSRPLLNRSDKLRLNSMMTRQGKKMLHFGETSGQQSAFMLDFGSVLVIEFNGVGAVYVYDEKTSKSLFQNIYTSAVFTDGKLKQQDYAAEKFRHQGDWQWRVSYTLAQFGIRPS